MLLIVLSEKLSTVTKYTYNFILTDMFIKPDGDSDDSIDDLEQLSMREYSQLSEQQRIALRGRAQLGEVSTTVIHLKESKQFKVGFREKFSFCFLIT